MSGTHFKLLVCLFILSGTTLAEAGCFKSVRELKAHHVGTRWQETTENDGMPLTISIADGGGGLVYSARKAGKLWLSGNVSVCQTGEKTEITLKNTKATNNVPALAKMGLPSTQTTYIANGQIKLAGGGWGGTFVSR